ncbi:MAG: 1-acyl-sn-glycerol-3-phosphate acyltransferase [Cyanobacteria bacterium SZAS LIN-3]|nr:1-acyl-sn-glycerol-3-phosphate acyltransferase [Cyanobacteria bacterium SZAS LIN-3]
MTIENPPAKQAETKPAAELRPIKALPLDIKRFTPWRIKVQMFVGRTIMENWHRTFNHLQVEGRENIPAEGSLIIVGNHISNQDPPLLTVATHRHMIFMAKRELWFIRPLGMWIDFLGAIPINRDKPELSALKFMKEVLKTGWSLGMFIEGTRCKVPNSIGRPHLGAAYFAKITKSNILPVGIIGSNAKTGKAHIKLKIGKPIPYSDDLEKTTWETMDALAELTGFTILERKLAEKGSNALG